MRLRSYSVNNDAAGKAAAQRLQAEHDRLHQLLSTFVARVREGDESALTPLLDQIESFCTIHFQHEEAVIRAKTAAGADRHRSSHRLLLRQLEQLRRAITSQRPVLISAASHWYTAMINHIDDVDRPGLARLLMDVPAHELTLHGWHVDGAQ